MNNLFPLSLYYNKSVYRRLNTAIGADIAKLGFFNFDVEYALKTIKNIDPQDLEVRAKNNHRKLRKYVIEKVEAYKKFIKLNGATLIDKSNYLSKFGLNQLVPGPNMIDSAKVISVSSGSSGKPYFWPREEYLEIETTIVHEMILKDIFEIDKYSTLVVNAYSMGMYVAGIFTNNVMTRLALKGYNISIISPGIAIDDVLRIINDLSPYYQQIIICGYPPFVKDIIEKGYEYNINWKRNKLRFIFGAEAISEDWRSYLYKKAGVKDYYKSSINTYGSADLAVLGHETPITILIKKIVSENQEISASLFNKRSVVSFIQYHPHLKYFETEGGELICSGMGGIPLYRYNLHDEGQIYSLDEMVNLLYTYGIDILKEAKKNNIEVWKLPFIVLFGKSDHTVTLYGLNIYPQTIRKALDNHKLSHLVSGRSTMETKYNEKQVQYIQILIELNKGIKPNKLMNGKIKKIIMDVLIQDNYEYRTLFEKIGRQAEPHITLTTYGEIAHNRGIKQQWIKKI